MFGLCLSCRLVASFCPLVDLRTSWLSIVGARITDRVHEGAAPPAADLRAAQLGTRGATGGRGHTRLIDAWMPYAAPRNRRIEAPPDARYKIGCQAGPPSFPHPVPRRRSVQRSPRPPGFFRPSPLFSAPPLSTQSTPSFARKPISRNVRCQVFALPPRRRRGPRARDRLRDVARRVHLVGRWLAGLHQLAGRRHLALALRVRCFQGLCLRWQQDPAGELLFPSRPLCESAAMVGQTGRITTTEAADERW